jgi:hypothetical protein
MPEEYNGYVYEYDMNSAYQWILNRNNLGIPICAPEYKHIDELNDVIEFGLYDCVIEKGNNYFTYTKNSIYTHMDLNRARQLNLTITMNEGINCLLYKKRIPAGHMFSNFVHIFQDLDKVEKTDECKNMGKFIRNVLWGALCEKNKIVQYPNKDGVLETDSDNWDIVEYSKNKKDNYECEYIPYEQPYIFNYARFGVFLVSYLRNHMSKLAEEHGTNVVRCATDSIYSKVPLNLDIGADYGQFKLKKEGNINIKNKMVFKWV